LVLSFLDRRLNFLSYRSKLNSNLIDRPYYGHGLFEAAKLARKLGCPRISAIEFGVASGASFAWWLNANQHPRAISKY